MKKFVALLLALVMALTLVACGSKEPVDTTVDNGEADAFTFTMGIDAEYPPSAIWAPMVNTPALTWRSAKRPASCWAGTLKSSV